jgi:hypothetical protein
MKLTSGTLVLDLLLGPQLVAVTTLLLAAVDSPWMQPCIAPEEK